MLISRIYQPKIKTPNGSFRIYVKVKSEYGRTFEIESIICKGLKVLVPDDIETTVIIDNRLKETKFETISYAKYQATNQSIERYKKTNQRLDVNVPISINNEEIKIATFTMEIRIINNQEFLYIILE